MNKDFIFNRDVVFVMLAFMAADTLDIMLAMFPTIYDIIDNSDIHKYILMRWRKYRLTCDEYHHICNVFNSKNENCYTRKRMLNYILEGFWDELSYLEKYHNIMSHDKETFHSSEYIYLLRDYIDPSHYSVILENLKTILDEYSLVSVINKSNLIVGTMLSRIVCSDIRHDRSFHIITKDINRLKRRLIDIGYGDNTFSNNTGLLHRGHYTVRIDLNTHKYIGMFLHTLVHDENKIMYDGSDIHVTKKFLGYMLSRINYISFYSSKFVNMYNFDNIPAEQYGSDLTIICEDGCIKSFKEISSRSRPRRHTNYERKRDNNLVSFHYYYDYNIKKLGCIYSENYMLCLLWIYENAVCDTETKLRQLLDYIFDHEKYDYLLKIKHPPKSDDREYSMVDIILMMKNLRQPEYKKYRLEMYTYLAKYLMMCVRGKNDDSKVLWYELVELGLSSDQSFMYFGYIDYKHIANNKILLLLKRKCVHGSMYTTLLPHTMIEKWDKDIYKMLKEDSVGIAFLKEHQYVPFIPYFDKDTQSNIIEYLYWYKNPMTHPYEYPERYDQFLCLCFYDKMKLYKENTIDRHINNDTCSYRLMFIISNFLNDNYKNNINLVSEENIPLYGDHIDIIIRFFKVGYDVIHDYNILQYTPTISMMLHTLKIVVERYVRFMEYLNTENEKALQCMDNILYHIRNQYPSLLRNDL